VVLGGPVPRHGLCHRESFGEAMLPLATPAGLGEMMPEQLWSTTLDPTKRRLKQITVDEAVEAERTLSLLMGDKVRRQARVRRPVRGEGSLAVGHSGPGRGGACKLEWNVVSFLVCLTVAVFAGGPQEGAHSCTGNKPKPSHVGHLTSLSTVGLGSICCGPNHGDRHPGKKIKNGSRIRYELRPELIAS